MTANMPRSRSRCVKFVFTQTLLVKFYINVKSIQAHHRAQFLYGINLFTVSRQIYFSNTMASSAALTNVSTFLPLKLESHNYPLWCAQFVPLLQSRSLMPFVVDTSQCPPTFLLDDEGQLIDTIYPLFESWIQQDHMVLSWLTSSLSPPIMHVVVKCINDVEEWKAFQEKYAPSSHNRVIQLRGELLNLHRGDISIANFFG